MNVVDNAEMKVLWFHKSTSCLALAWRCLLHEVRRALEMKLKEKH